MVVKQKRVRMGRPAGPPEAVRRNRVTFTLTDAELARLRRAADARGLPLGTLAYEYVIAALSRARR
jgi:hypothetical protein